MTTESASAIPASELKKLMDTSLVHLSVGKIHYQVPRNFLVGMSNWNGGPQKTVDIKIKYPGFLPFSKETEACFLKLETCKTIQFTIYHESVSSSKEEFDKALIAFKAKLLKREDGYESFGVGPPEMRGEYFYKSLADREFAFSCTPDLFSEGRKIYGSCLVSTRTRAGTVIRYRFSKSEIKDVDAIDTGLRDLVDSFVVEEK